MHVNLTIRPESECHIEPFAYVVCAVNKSNMEGAICSGDSGGPLICNNEVVGIVSYSGEVCSNEKVLSHYTNVYEYRQWIFINEGNIKWIIDFYILIIALVYFIYLLR